MAKSSNSRVTISFLVMLRSFLPMMYVQSDIERLFCPRNDVSQSSIMGIKLCMQKLNRNRNRLTGSFRIERLWQEKEMVLKLCFSLCQLRDIVFSSHLPTSSIIHILPDDNIEFRQSTVGPLLEIQVGLDSGTGDDYQRSKLASWTMDGLG